MQLVQEERLGGNSLGFADKCRKGLAKKIGALFDECEQTFYQNIKEKKCSEILAHYVWDVLLKVQRGYSFNRSHCLAYSLVALQEMNLAYRYPIIFWNCACLITDSGGQQMEGEEKGSTDYTKMATALSKMIQAGISIKPPNVNTSGYTFTPDVQNNQIVFGLSGILNVGEDIIEDTIKNRPYDSIKDYYLKVKPKRQSMVSLIKGGAFDDMMDRKEAMIWYIWETCDKKKRLTLQNMPGLIKHNLLIQDTDNQKDAYKVYEFNRYLKAKCKYSTIEYKLDERAIDFLCSFGYDSMIISNDEGNYLNVKKWDKEYQNWMDIFREWISENKEDILNDLNGTIFMEDWNKYAAGSYSSWEMEVLCFYYHKHELANVNNRKYWFADFYKLPEDPEVEKTFKKGDKEIKLFKLHKICGTCIAKNKAKGTVTLLTTSGVVNVRFRKEYFSIFDKQISEKQSDGTKKVKEKSWFNRGSMIMVQGIRSGDEFIPKKYSSSASHQLYKITSIDEDGDLTFQSERYKGDIEEDD